MDNVPSYTFNFTLQYCWVTQARYKREGYLLVVLLRILVGVDAGIFTSQSLGSSSKSQLQKNREQLLAGSLAFRIFFVSAGNGVIGEAVLRLFSD